ncbi:MAG: anhydro-N-acetylmuramic acid kinase [Gammaproteobacteria bacterium]
MERYIGLMSGTSVDAIDAALVEFEEPPPPDDTGNGEPAFRVLHTLAFPFSPELRERINAVIAGDLAHAKAIWRLDREIGECFAEAALALVAAAGEKAEGVRAIASHGQTVYHAPSPPEAITVQLGDPNLIAERTGITTVADLRRRDVAAGGQGAPLAPAFHSAMLRSGHGARAVLNLGGIANLSLLPAQGEAGAVLGFDTGPANTLLDRWCEARTGRPFDRDADWASTGSVIDDLLDALLADPYFAVPPPKSTGREHFHLAWLERALPSQARGARDEDVARTLVELTARTAADALLEHGPHCIDVLVCGGGAHNPLLMDRLAKLMAPRTVATTLSAGLHPDWVEAVAFAWLAQQTLARKPGNIPSVTGASAPVVLGAVYAGAKR